MERAEFASRLQGKKLALFDLDNTVVRGHVSAGVGYGYLNQEYQKRNWRNVLIGLCGGILAEIYRRTGNERRGVEAFVSALNSAGCVDEASAYRFAYKYVATHGIPGLGEMLNQLGVRGMQTTVYTGALEVSAQAAKNEFGFDDCFGVYSIEGDKILPSRFTAPTRSKEKAVQRYLREKQVKISSRKTSQIWRRPIGRRFKDRLGTH
jgi:phosphoserine phosphatase